MRRVSGASLAGAWGDASLVEYKEYKEYKECKVPGSLT